mgnify:CR=1 FL=1
MGLTMVTTTYDRQVAEETYCYIIQEYASWMSITRLHIFLELTNIGMNDEIYNQISMGEPEKFATCENYFCSCYCRSPVLSLVEGHRYAQS